MVAEWVVYLVVRMAVTKAVPKAMLASWWAPELGVWVWMTVGS